MFRPQRATVSLAIAAEPAEKPDARLLALALGSPRPLISQRISPEHLTLTILRRRVGGNTMKNKLYLSLGNRSCGCMIGLIEQRQSIAQVCEPFSVHTKQHHECYRCS